MKDVSIYPLRLPRSLRDEVERMSRLDGTRRNPFVATAVAAKVAAMETASFFQDRRNRADYEAFDRIMSRAGGETPRDGDEVPE